MNNQEKVKLLYDSGKSVGEVAKELNMLPSNVSMYLNKSYGKTRPRKEKVFINGKYTLNQDYFNKIDNIGKAYFLGLIYADGCISNNSLRISLQEEDKDILYKFGECINSNKPIIRIHNPIVKGFSTNKQYVRKDQFLLVITSNRLKESLYKLGVTSKKSLTIKFPTFLSDMYIWHFIRGYYDGDGCLYIGSKNKVRVTFACNEVFGQELSNFLRINNINNTLCKHSSNNCFYVTITGRLNVIDLCDKMYLNGELYIGRKKEKYEECKSKTKTIRYNGSWRKEKSQ